MSSIHFILNEAQEEELAVLMKHEGITSRAGFFRFLMKFYKYNQASFSQQSSLSSTSPRIQKTLEVPANDQTLTLERPDDSKLSPKKQKLLSNPHIFDEEVRQLIRDMEE